MEKQLRKELENMFIDSLEKDNDKWNMKMSGAAGYDWIEYHSPSYDNISYVYTELGHSCDVYISGYREYSFSMSFLNSFKVKRLLKQIKQRKDDARINELKNKINESKKNIENKEKERDNKMEKRYAVGYYSKEEAMKQEWMNISKNRLAAFIYDNQDMFKIKYKAINKGDGSVIFLIDIKEIEKAKECFIKEDTRDVIDLIDMYLNYDEDLQCDNCDNIIINKASNKNEEGKCALCSCLGNITFKVLEETTIKTKRKDSSEKHFVSDIFFNQLL